MPAFRTLISASLFFFMLSAPAFACTPCLTKSPIKRTVAQASVIVQVENNDRDSSASLTSGPETVSLTVKKLFKGDLGGESSISVHSWYGECPFGVHLPVGGEAIILLQEHTDINTGEWDGTYKLVEDGCSEGQLEVKRDILYLSGGSMPVSEFVSTYVH